MTSPTAFALSKQRVTQDCYSSFVIDAEQPEEQPKRFKPCLTSTQALSMMRSSLNCIVLPELNFFRSAAYGVRQRLYRHRKGAHRRGRGAPHWLQTGTSLCFAHCSAAIHFP